MTAPELVNAVENAGGLLTLNGDRIRCNLPEDAADLLDLLRARRDEVVGLLQKRAAAVGAQPVLPPGVRLIRWELKNPPVAITKCSIVTNVELFAHSKLRQLGSALEGKTWLAGNWSVRELVETLEQVGVVVEVVQ